MNALSPRQLKAEEAGRWLTTMPDGTASAGEIGAHFGWNHARQAEAIKEMREQGWVEGPKGTVRLTSAGWARFGGDFETAGAGDVLEQALDGFPQAYRAFVQLLVSAIIARHHLSEARPSGHLAFAAIGDTGTGKTALGRLVCDLFAWEPAHHELHLPMQSSGSLLGRRDRTPDGWAWQPASTTRLPFLILDEIDKADEAVKRQAMLYMQGERVIRAEDQLHHLLPTTMVAANPPTSTSAERHSVLRPEYRRRSAVLDTGFMRSRRTEIERLLTEYYATTQRPRLSLERLRPPDQLAPQARIVLEQASRALTEQGALEFPGIRTLELATLGRCALIGPDADHRLAAFSVALDYLQVTETVPGQLHPGWQPDAAVLREHFGASAEAMLEAQERGRREREQQRASVVHQRNQKASDTLAVERQAHELAAKMRGLRDRLDGRRITQEPDATRERAAGLRTVLSKLATQAANISTASALEDLRAQASAHVADAETLAVEIERATQRRAQEKRDQARQEQEERERLANLARMERRRHEQQIRDQKDQARGALEVLRAAARDLEQLYQRSHNRPGEDAFTTLRDYRLEGRPLITWRPRPSLAPRVTADSGPKQYALSFLAAIGEGLTATDTPPGRWQVTTEPRLSFPGTARSCPDLSSWGANTRAVLAVYLTFLHQQEDKLTDFLGVRRRTRRPVITTHQQHVALPAPRL